MRLAAEDLVWESDFGSALGLADDDCAQISIGFEFEYFGSAYTELWVNTNGNVTFDECNRNYSAPDIPYGDPEYADILIAALWGDFIGGIDGDIFVNTVGSEAERRFVITWSQVREYEGSTGPNSFQLQLFEASNMIQLGYNGLSTDGINWIYTYPSDDPQMDVGIDSGTGSYLNSASGSAIPALDMTNICYTPDGDGYEETRAACESGPLRVECDPNYPNLFRGDVVTCEASAVDPEAELQVLGWQFTDGEHVVPYQPPDPGNRFWAGTMAVDGTVTVLATVDGDSAEASTTVSVQPRDWPDVLPAPTVETVQCPVGRTDECPLKYPPQYVRDLGETDVPHPFEAELFPIEDDGPNDGLSFLLSEGPALKYTKHVTYLNAILDQPNHPFWPAGCNVSAFKQTVVSHEQIHVSLMINNLEMADPGPNARLERIILWGSPDSLDIMLDDTLTVLDAVINQYGDQAHQVNPPVTLPCNVNVKP